MATGQMSGTMEAEMTENMTYINPVWFKPFCVCVMEIKNRPFVLL